MTLVGSDLAGEAVLSALRGAGVDDSRVTRSTEIPTSLCLADVKDSGERAFVAPRHGTASAFGAAHVEQRPLESGLKVLSVGSLNCSRELDTYVLPSLLAEARAQGITVVADMVSDHPEVTLADLAPVLRNVDYLVPSELELELYAGTIDPRRAFDVVSAFGVRALVVKQGSRGATLVGDGQIVTCEALDVPVLDTTGAGDCFVAGLVSGLIRGLSDRQLLMRAIATAAVSVQHLGATAGVTGASDVDALIELARIDRESASR
jgi:sugar/nucleoside kinase (ribokinase family)